MDKAITIRLPENIRVELEKLSHCQKVTISDLVREALTNYLALKRFRTLRDRVLPFAEAEGLLTDEDLFKAIS